MDPTLFAAAVEGSAFGRWAAQGAWVYPIANVLHVLGLAALLGAIALLDLRVLGVAPAVPLRAAAEALTPVAIAGFLVLAASGSVLFAADARALVQSPIYLAKLGLVALALLNALAFRLRWRRFGHVATPAMMALAAVSLGLWGSVAVLGRLIAYL